MAARYNAAAVVAQAPELVFLAIPDQAVPQYATALAAERERGDTAFVHVSGALPLSALDPVRAAGARVGSFHPLQSFAAAREPAAFRDVMVAVDASDDALLEQLRDLARQLGARPERVTDGQRPLYHTAAVMASNYLVALAAEAADVLARAGWARDEALQNMLPLMRGTLDNLGVAGLPDALTGPIRRGDIATVERNLAALDRELPDAARAYRMLGLAALELAQEAGLNRDRAEDIRMALTR